MVIMETLKNKKREFFCSWRGNLAAGPSKDEGTVQKKLWIREEMIHRTKKPGLLR